MITIGSTCLIGLSWRALHVSFRGQSNSRTLIGRQFRKKTVTQKIAWHGHADGSQRNVSPKGFLPTFAKLRNDRRTSTECGLGRVAKARSTEPETIPTARLGKSMRILSISIVADTDYIKTRPGTDEVIRIATTLQIHLLRFIPPWLLPLIPHPSRVTQSSGRATMTASLPLLFCPRALPTR